MAERPIILAADDQPDNLLVLEDLLHDHYEVITAADGAQVLDHIARNPAPDLILMDVVMPGLDGFETCRRLKESPEHSDIPVIFLTALDGAAEEERGLSLGADDFIHKPFVPGVVLARVRNLLGRREAEQRRRQMAALEARLAEQQRNSDTLVAAVDKLTVLNSELERIAFVAAHDLREPARAITTYAQMLEKRCAHKLDEAELDYLGYLGSGARRVYDMIGGLLDYSRQPAIASDPHPVSADSACKTAIAALAAMVEETQATITLEPLPDVLADDILLAQVFQNLIGNAIKFHHPHRAPLIAITAARHGDECQFQVTDNGIGFAPDEQDVFELFRQLGPHDRRTGIGAGLAICKRIIQRLGGRVWVRSTLGSGSSFGFSLPGVDKA